MMERYISIYRNLLAKSILTIDYSNPASSSPLLPPCEPEPPPEGVCEPEVEPLPLSLPELPGCEPPEVDPELPEPPGSCAEPLTVLKLVRASTSMVMVPSELTVYMPLEIIIPRRVA